MVLLVLGLLALLVVFWLGLIAVFWLGACGGWFVCVVCDLVLGVLRLWCDLRFGLGLRLLGVGLGWWAAGGFWISLVGVLVSNWFGVLCWFSGFCFRVV